MVKQGRYYYAFSYQNGSFGIYSILLCQTPQLDHHAILQESQDLQLARRFRTSVLYQLPLVDGADWPYKKIIGPPSIIALRDTPIKPHRERHAMQEEQVRMSSAANDRQNHLNRACGSELTCIRLRRVPQPYR